MRLHAARNAKEESVAPHIEGPLYYERMGRHGPALAFVHPNPYDQSCWMYQLAHFSTWFRCIAIDLPGYGRSPRADAGLQMEDLAVACWEAIDQEFPGEQAILVGCSVGSQVVQYMWKENPGRTAGLVLTGAAYVDEHGRALLGERIRDYESTGVEFRRSYAFEDFSPAFRSTSLARYFVDVLTERDDHVDVPSVVAMFRAMQAPYPAGLHDVDCPTLILNGSEDVTYTHGYVDTLVRHLPGCSLKLVYGAGHIAQLEQPWIYDQLLIDFLKAEGLFPSPNDG
jgi:pimeloyl-ACP methyl ester carboxylesterase